MQPHGLSQATFHAVSNDRFPESLGDCESDFGSIGRAPMFGVGALETEGCEIRAGKARTLVINLAEVRAAKYSGGLREPISQQRPNLPTNAYLPTRLALRSGQRVRR